MSSNILLAAFAILAGQLVIAGSAHGQIGTPGGRTIGGGNFAVTCGGFNDRMFSLPANTVMKKQVLCATVNNPAGSGCQITMKLEDANSIAIVSAPINPNQTRTLCGANVGFLVTDTGTGTGVVNLTWRVDRADDAGK
jgi:hypothetical protein